MKRHLALVAVTVLLTLGVQSLVTSMSRVRRDDRALIACMRNDAYTRDLLGQCLDDWKDAH